MILLPLKNAFNKCVRLPRDRLLLDYWIHYYTIHYSLLHYPLSTITHYYTRTEFLSSMEAIDGIVIDLGLDWEKFENKWQEKFSTE